MPRRSAQVGFVILMVATAGAALGAPTLDDEGPVIVGERRKEFNWFDLQNFHAALDFTGRYQEHRQDDPNLGRLHDRERYTLTELTMGGESYIGHKNLIDLTANITLGYEHESLDSETANAATTDNTSRVLFDINAVVLQQAFVSPTVYARRDETTTDREFLSTIHTTTSEYGTIASIRSTAAPTTIQVFHREQDQRDPTGIVDYGMTQDALVVHSQIRLDQSQRLQGDYTFDHVREHQQTLFTDEYDRHDATISHDLTFGQQDQHLLRSTFRAFDQGGLYAHSTFRFDEQLQLRHSRSLETTYSGRYEDSETLGISQRILQGRASLRHQLFSSLTTSAGIGGSVLDIPNTFHGTEWNANLGWDYTKKVPWGRLDAGLAGAFTRQDNGDRGSTIPILNDSRTFIGTQAVSIDRRHIVASSIRVTDSTGGILYQEGIDYTVLAFPDHVEIRTLVGSAIQPGQITLISYDIGPEPANQFDSLSTSASLRYTINEGTLNGLGAFVQYLGINQSLDSTDASLFVVDDTRDLRYGLEYRHEGIALLAERRNHDSRISPYDLTRLEARYTQRLGRGSSLSFAVADEHTKYDPSLGTLDLFRASGDWTQQLTNELDMHTRLIYRDESGSVSGTARGFEESLELRWHRGKTTISSSIRHTTLDTGPSNNDTLTFVLGVRRDF